MDSGVVDKGVRFPFLSPQANQSNSHFTTLNLFYSTHKTVELSHIYQVIILSSHSSPSQFSSNSSQLLILLASILYNLLTTQHTFVCFILPTFHIFVCFMRVNLQDGEFELIFTQHESNLQKVYCTLLTFNCFFSPNFICSSSVVQSYHLITLFPDSFNQLKSLSI